MDSRRTPSETRLPQMIKEFRDNMPAILEFNAIQAKIMYADFRNLVDAGFTEDQAMQLVKIKASSMKGGDDE